MNRPPKMISTKDSGSFNDQLNSIDVLCKKLNLYEESDIKMTLSRVNSTLKNHYSELLGCLNNG